MRISNWVMAACIAVLVVAWGVTGCEAKKPEGAAAPPETGAMKPAEAAPTPAPVPTPAPEMKPVQAPAEKAKEPGKDASAVVKACAKAPVIDGDLSDDCWKSAEIPGVWVDVYTGRAAKPMSKVYVCVDDKFVYVAFLNPETKMKNLVADATDRDGNVWEDDSNELFLDPSAGKKDYYQFIVNTKNVLYDGRGKDGSWNSNAKCAVKKMDDGWSVEIAIPLAEMEAQLPLKGQAWTANFCRNRRTEGDTQAFAWSDTGESFHNPDAFGKLKME